MPNNNTISLSFKIADGADGLKTLTIDANNLKKALESTVKAADELKKPFINFAALATGISAAQDTIRSLQSTLKGLTDAYSVQIEVETQLATNMRNTMQATDAEIDSIKQLCSAQQQLGVIGDEVQLAGAQELATFLTKKQSLEQLIPVMNDMVAQQYGYTASAENAFNIAKVFGKALDGQVGALSRYGYSVDEAQAKILKFGSEEERVAVLAEIVEAKVGGSNEALAQMPYGAVKQMANSLGDMKEQLGAVAVKVQPILDIGASAVISLGGVVSLVRGIKTLDASMKSASVSAKVLKWSIRGLLAVTGFGLVFAAATTVLDMFVGKEKEAEAKTNELAQAMKRFAADARDTSDKVGRYADAEISRLDRLYKAATDETKSRKERIKAAKELQSIYPSYFSNLSAEDIALGKAKKGYDELSASILKNARIKAAADKIVENEATAFQHQRKAQDARDQYEKLLTQKSDLANRARTELDIVFPGGPEILKETYMKSLMFGIPMKKIDKYAKLNDIATQAATLKASMSELSATYTENADMAKELADANEEIAESYGVTLEDLQKAESGFSGFMPEAPKVEQTEEKTRLQEINEELEKLRNAYVTANASGKQSILSRASALELEKERIEAIRKEFDDRGTYDFTVNMSNAQFEIEEGGTDGLVDRLNTIRDLSDAIDILKQKQQDASTEEIADLQLTINTLEEKLAVYDKFREKQKEPFNTSASTLKDIQNNIGILNEQLQTASVEEAASLNREIELWNKKAEAIRNAGVAGESVFSTFRKGWSAVTNIENAIAGVTSTLNSDASSWEKFSAVVNASLQVYDGIMSIVNICNALLSITKANTIAKTAEATAIVTSAGAQTGNAIAAETAAAAQAPVIAANKLAAGSYMELAAAAYFAAHAFIPFAGFGIASGFVTAATAIVQGIGIIPFADGGIVSGPTVGLIGEYAGAANNPEVVAPLDRLRDLVKSQGGIDAGKVEFVIDGRVLRGVLRKVDNLSNRS